MLKTDRLLPEFVIDIDDFLDEEIRGPAEFVCGDDKKCVFEGKVDCTLWAQVEDVLTKPYAPLPV